MNSANFKLSRIVQTSLLQGLSIFGVVLMAVMVAIGVSVGDALKISIVVLIQWLSGSIIWSKFIRRGASSTIDAIALGAPIGFAISAFSDQLFLPTLLHSVGWLIPQIAILLYVMTSSKDNEFNTDAIDLPNVYLLAITASLIGLGGLYFVYIAGAVTMLISLALLHKRSTVVRHPLFAHSAIIASSVAIYIAVRLNNPQPTSILRPIFQDSDDHIFSEQMSWSLAHLGIFDNSSAIGTPIKYHWLSLAWSGLVSRVSGVGPWSVNLVLVPIITFFILSLIFVALVHKYWHLKWVVFLSPLLLIATDDPSTILRFYSNSATTNLLPHIWIAATVFLLIRFTFERDWRFRLFIAVLSAATVLGKGPSGVVLLGGLVGLLIYGAVFWRNRAIRPLIGTSVLGIVAIVATYLLFINDTNNITYSPSWDQIRSLFPFPLLADVPDGSKLALPIGSLFFMTFLCRRFFIIFFCSTKSAIKSAPYWLILGSCSAGMLSFVLYNLGGTQYFLNAAFTIGAMGSVYLLTNDVGPHLDKFWTQIPKRIYLFGASVWLGLLLLIHLSKTFLEQRFYSVQTFTYLIPLAVFVVILTLVCIRKQATANNDFTKYSRVAQIGFIIFTFTTFTSFVQRIDLSPASPSDSAVSEIASAGEIEALSWIDKHVPQSVTLATNRSLCESSVSCNSQSGSHLVSAISQRRVLLEGPRFIPSSVSADGIYTPWALKRATASLGFIMMPNRVNTQQLADYGVTYIYVSKTAQTPTTWGPWAEVIFENTTSLVLHLKQLD
jgi:hypothetical protein